MASPQTENGFTRIANEILENVYSRKFAANQLAVLLVIWRYTYGFQRKDHEFSLSFLVDATGIDRKAVKRALDSLIDNNVVNTVKDAGFTSARVLEFNKNYDAWSIEHRGGKNDHTPGGKNDHQERKVKDISKESSSSDEKPFANIIKFYESNLQRGLSETPFNLELIGQWFDEWGHDLLLAAMKVSAKAEAKGVNFTEGVLRNWKEAGVKNIDDARKYEREFRKPKGTSKRGKNKPKAEDFNLDD